MSNKKSGKIKKDKVISVANYFLKKYREEKEKGIDAKKLQKLLYYAQAWNLVLNNKELFKDDFEAWVHGPAIYKVWDKFKTEDLEELAFKIEDNFKFLPEEIKVLDTIWNVYGKFDGSYLETLTHEESPWLDARRGLKDADPSHSIISKEDMKSYYGKRLKEAKERS